MLHTVVLDVPAGILVHVERVDNAEGQLVGLALSSEAARFFHGNYLAVWVKFVEEEDEELVQELADSRSVPFFRADVLLFDRV